MLKRECVVSYIDKDKWQLVCLSLNAAFLVSNVCFLHFKFQSAVKVVSKSTSEGC